MPATKATVAALEFIAAAPSLPLDMPWSLQSRWTWSFPPAWLRVLFGERQMASMPDGVCPFPILYSWDVHCFTAWASKWR